MGEPCLFQIEASVLWLDLSAWNQRGSPPCVHLGSCKVTVSCNQFRPVLTPDHVQKHAVFHDRKSSHHFTDASGLPDADELTNDEGRTHHALQFELARSRRFSTHEPNCC